MKKIITLSIVCLVSGQLFAQTSAAKLQPIDAKTKAQIEAQKQKEVSSMSLPQAIDANAIPVTTSAIRVSEIKPNVIPVIPVTPVTKVSDAKVAQDQKQATTAKQAVVAKQALDTKQTVEAKPAEAISAVAPKKED